MTIRGWSGLLLTLWLSGCGGGPKPGAIGAACTTGESCAMAAQQACLLAWPDGYCTEYSCSTGSCPDGSRCVTGLTFVGIDVHAFCLATCNSSPDCRAHYRCADSGGAGEKVCVPDAP